jgi:hypothetical protein
LQLPEVQAIAAFVGTPSPIDFNGMVRRYYQRSGPHLADLRLTLVDKADREHQSHAVVLRLREVLAPLNDNGVSIKVVEVPPGPPVLSTLVAEVQADPIWYRMNDSAKRRHGHGAHGPGAAGRGGRFHGRESAAAPALHCGQGEGGAVRRRHRGHQPHAGPGQRGLVAGYLQAPHETQPLPIELRLAESDRAALADFNGCASRAPGHRAAEHGRRDSTAPPSRWCSWVNWATSRRSGPTKPFTARTCVRWCT